MVNISSQERNLFLLVLISEALQPLTAGDLLKLSGFSKSTLYRQLNYLKHWGLLSEYNGRFYSGPVTLSLGQALLRSMLSEGLEQLKTIGCTAELLLPSSPDTDRKESGDRKS
ncbi:helix-turn-helix domain-containing protein [Photobacterium sp. ZSDE20]|uniref:Helix-turn-helix domain-containing protein n=1 Tax=Photobacterium pectinilyticum TaxID=2906793 RepID=A0ABT1N959_9GAMM|nr:helix-turn-helix domain-containing protein [Photobacterium sp. ZSDE20]MCQ1061285.1 helix-turn-helix domain-containing protein [Photobacterium sp. ZSDE20]MDD1829786.1 helix-turn-helix domain-containing protein [Photobacterium sp. ZSDE20]